MASYAKGFEVPVGSNFTSREFDCPCARDSCQTTIVDSRLVEGLEALRRALGPLAINSGFRCSSHNAEVGGKPDSQHLIGFAADIRSLRGHTGFSIAQEAESVPCFARGGIGIAGPWAHVDVRQTGAARWRYPLSSVK